MACATSIVVLGVRRVMITTVHAQQAAAVLSADPDRQPASSFSGGLMHLVTDALELLARSGASSGNATDGGSASGSNGSDRDAVARHTRAVTGNSEV